VLAVYPYIAANSPPTLEEDLTEAQQNVADLSDDELIQIRDVLAEYPEFWDLPEAIHTYLGPGDQDTQSPQQAFKPGVPSILMAHTCIGGPGVAAEFVLKGLALVAEGVIEALPTDGLTIAARIGFVVLWVAAEAAVLTAEGFNEANSDCEHAADQALTHTAAPRVDVVLSTRASKSSQDNQGTTLHAKEATLSTHDTNIQDTLNKVTEMKYVHLQLIETPAPKGTGERIFLLAASEVGVPVSVTCEAVQAAKSSTPFTWVDVTTNTTCTVEKASGGIHKVVIDLATPGIVAHLFEIQVKHEHGGDPAHFGIAVFDRRHAKNMNIGQ